MFKLEEATITELQDAMEQGKVTSKQLVQMYLERIQQYDSILNALTIINPNALETAAALDDERATKGPRGLLHGIPVIVKDNYDTYDMPTTAGSKSLEGSIPPDDAFQVAKLREAGAVIIAKSNMAEFAFSPNETVSSIGGTTVNPYDIERVPAGSSGGTAAAIAANFAVVGLGTDTGNSIRGPGSHTSLVGIRSTMGLTSRDGIVPIILSRDIGGPLARTVTDAAIILDTIAGYDPKDPVTAKSVGHMPDSYLDFCDKNGLNGARIGVLRQYFPDEEIDSEVKQLIEQAIIDLRNQGAIIVDDFNIPNLEQLFQNANGPFTMKTDIKAYLETLGPNAPVKSLDEIIESGKYHPSIEEGMKYAHGVKLPPEDDPDFYKSEVNREVYRLSILKAMADQEVDVFIFPTWNYPPRKIGDWESPHGNNSYQMSPPTGFPALTVPMGFTYGNLPAGLQMLGRPFSEPTLIKYAYAYEQATKHRRAPEL
ncbi:amidase family protein [Litchfieldia alkalitelluris]|uniref:amidase family protein n=1 Tax=Litchfieldia alkalitelluris TaxID=304268 RepID=UPI001956A54C|nr:amidase family protein [Litchfieldia alkalitelluris]